MKLPKVDRPFVIVEWDDAWKGSISDTTFENADDQHEPIKCIMAGWLLRDNEKGIQLACEYSPDDKMYRQRSFVPRQMVTAIHVVKITVQKPPKVKVDNPVA